MSYLTVLALSAYSGLSTYCWLSARTVGYLPVLWAIFLLLAICLYCDLSVLWAQKNIEKKIGPKEVLSKKDNGQQKSRLPKKLDPKKMDKIGSVKTEILLIWRNVARTYVTWKNVTIWHLLKMVPGIYL